ncbi:MAG TPA: EMC3/TMCO1 family protein [Thermoplasmata archaeon]|nr:EMC3/TMCO1 family protein [Thermoplasmata archaeon]
MADDSAPLPSEPTEPVEPEVEAAAEPAAPARPPVPPFKASTFFYTFLMILGLFMIFDTGTRNLVAQGLAYVLNPTIGFGGHYLIASMAAAAVIEMLLQAVAYNLTTDWVKAAKVQKWSGAFRKVQMAAVRSGKKDRVEALKPHQSTLTRLSSEVSMAQLKGMAITWFLLIAMYTWVYLFISGSTTIGPKVSSAVVNLAGTHVDLLAPVAGPITLWFLLFSLYTVPSSLAFRRFFKHYSLARHPQAPASSTTGDA